MTEVPDADISEQNRPVDPDDEEPVTPHTNDAKPVPPADEGDSVEQSQDVPLGEEYR